MRIFAKRNSRVQHIQVIYDRALTPEELGGSDQTAGAYAEVAGNDTGKSTKTDFAFGSGTTVNLWFNADSIPSDTFAILLAKGTKSTNRHWELYTEKGNLQFYAPGGNGGQPISLKTDLRAYTGGWHMLTVIHTEDKFEVYVDGAHIQSIAAAFTLETGGDALYYGRLVEGGFDFGGKIAEVELLTEILPDTAITDRYKAKLVTPEDTAAGGIKVEQGLMTLLPGETAELPVKALGETALKLTVVGDAVGLADGTLTAQQVGETLIYAVSEDGRYLGGVVVRVVESIPEDTTEPETDKPDEPVDTDDPATKDPETSGKGSRPYRALRERK